MAYHTEDCAVHKTGSCNCGISFDGMVLNLPEKRRMLAVYRSGVLLGLCSTRANVEKMFFPGWDPINLARMVEDTQLQFRVVPVVVNLELYEDAPG